MYMICPWTRQNTIQKFLQKFEMINQQHWYIVSAFFSENGWFKKAYMDFFNVIPFLIKNPIVSSVQTSIVMFYNQSLTFNNQYKQVLRSLYREYKGSILPTYICKDYLTTLRLKQIDWALFYLVSGGSGTSGSLSRM